MVKLEHKFTRRLHQSGILEKTNSVKEFIANTIAHADTLLEDEGNGFKGRAFEVFDEFWLRTCSSNLSGIMVKEYHPADNIIETLDRTDHGVDGYGVLHNNSKFTRQCKFKSNPTQLLDRNEDHVGNFYESSTCEFEIPPKSKHLMTWATTGQGMSANCSDYTSVTNIHTYINTINNDTFWPAFRKAVAEFCIDHAIKISVPALMDHQSRALEAISAFLNSQERRGKIYVPTGGGKTRIALEAIKALNASTPSKTVSLILAPRISLVKQHFQTIASMGLQSTFNIQICCSDREALELQDEVKDVIVKPTTNKLKIVQSIFDQKSTIVVSTYHSVEDLLAVLFENNVLVDLICCDEAHNLVSSDTDSGWNQMLDPTVGRMSKAGKVLFFTATAKLTESGARGMTDDEYFGRVLFQVDPRELMSKGVICKPMLIPVKCSLPEGGEIKDGKIEDIVEAIAEVRKSVTVSTDVFKAIVTCTGIEQAKALSEAVNADVAFSESGIKAWFQASDSSYYDVGQASRQQQFVEFKNAKSGVMFHYKTMGEGIDISDVNCVIMLREAGNIEVAQTIGRTLRLDPRDRAKILSGEIDPKLKEHEDRWVKPYGYVGVLYSDKDLSSLESRNRFQAMLLALRQDGFDFESKGETLGLLEEAEAFDEEIRIKPAIAVERPDDSKVLEIDNLDEDLTAGLNWDPDDIPIWKQALKEIQK